MPVDINGLLTTLDNRFINRANLLVLYNFAESGAILNKAPNYSGSYSGTLFGSDSFYYGSGTGFPTGHRVAINNTGNFYWNNFTHFFIVQKSGQANDNYFSSIAAESGFVNSGYLISSNDAGKLVFSFKDCTGPQSITSDFTLNNISNFAISKNDDVVTFYQYTPVSNILNSISFTVVGSQIFRSDYADLFFANSAPIGFLKDNYSGFVNNYLYFNRSLSATQVMDVFSGLYTTVIISGGATGNSFDECTGLFNLPSSTTPVTSGTAPAAVALTKNGIVLLRPFFSGSKVIVDYDTGNADVAWNSSGKYDFAKNNFVLNAAANTPPIIFLNGQRVVSGFAIITGSFCATGKVWEYDYNLIAKREIDDADSYNSDTDVIIYDVPNRHTWQQLFSGTGSVNINTGSGLAVFLNGQRILEYSISGSTLTFDAPRASGDRICIDYYQNGFGILGEVYNTGFFSTVNSFVENSSRVFYNGVRLLLGTDYLEISSGTLLQGAPLDKPLTEVVDITDFNVWNL